MQSFDIKNFNDIVKAKKADLEALNAQITENQSYDNYSAQDLNEDVMAWQEAFTESELAGKTLLSASKNEFSIQQQILGEFR